jgi:hypothetical protein
MFKINHNPKQNSKWQNNIKNLLGLDQNPVLSNDISENIWKWFLVIDSWRSEDNSGLSFSNWCFLVIVVHSSTWMQNKKI